jgi:beta-phosphoglucomutase-like phosphatase (HAD superfamily)
MITCEEAGAGKSDPRIFLLAADRMGLEPADIFVFEDVIHAIRTANRAGFVTVGVYDAASSSDNTAIREESGLYLHSLENWERFRDFALHAAK